MRKADVTRRSKTRVIRSTRSRFRLEWLEPRELLTVYTVTDTNDDMNQGSLRYAITQVNEDSNPDTIDAIDFAISGTGVQTIKLGSPLPAITHAVLIDGTSQNPSARTPQIAIDGSGLAALNAILDDTGGSCTIKDLAIVGCPGIGIELNGGANDLIEGCYVGTSDGMHAAANGTGIELIGSAGVTIGGTTAAGQNIISGNKANGIELLPGSNGVYATGALIEGNIIGLVAAGTSALGNGNDGIDQDGADATTIGGTTNGFERNIISGNSGDGIALGNGNNALVAGNYLGTDLTGKLALGNYNGLDLTGASYATIGGTVKGAGNLISGNTTTGINSFVLGSTAELIEGNLVGVDVTGTHALRNANFGIRIAGPTNCTVGGTAAAAANVISGNGTDGVSLTAGPSNGLVILGNYIGTDSAGDNLGNGGEGVTIDSDQVTIGGTANGAGNVIAFNGKSGIVIIGDDDENSFLSNSIHDNASLGINLVNGPTPNHLDEQGFTLPAPNDYQNYPVLTSATTTASSSEVIGTLNASASTTYLVQLFASANPDPSGYGQGQMYLGSTSVTTGADFNANIDAKLSTAVPAGWVVSATATDPIGNTSEFSQDIVPTPTSDVGVQITASPDPAVYAGGTLTYTVTVSNGGPETAQGVSVTDTLPQNIGSNVTASTSVSGVTPAISGNTVTAVLGEMGVNTTATLTITVEPNAGAVPQITDQAQVTSTTQDPHPGNNGASLTTTVDASADLALALSGSPGTVYVGSAVTYLLTAMNDGPSDADGVVVSDSLPADISSDVTASTSVSGVAAVIAGGQVTADLGTLAAGATATVSITVEPSAAAVPQISDSASITSSTYDPNESNNAPEPVTTTVQPAPVSDLSITMSGAPDPVYAGDNLTYTITATNGGPSTDPDAVVTDTLPANMSFVSATGGATPSGDVLTLPLGSLAANATRTITIVVAATAAAAGTDSGTITNSAVITGEYNGNLENSASVTTTVMPGAALGFQLTALPTLAQAGQDLTYTITAVNNGPSDATGVVVTDTLPADITSGVMAATSVAGVNATVAGGQVTASFGELDLGGSVTVTITVVPTLEAVSSSPLIDTAAITNNEFNPNSNTAMSSVPVAPVSDLSIAMSGTPDPVGAGSNVTYTIEATNTGPSTDAAAVVADTLPANVTFVSATGGATPDGGVVDIPLGSLAANASTSVRIVVTPTAAAAGTGTGTITNSAVISSPTDSNPENSASVETTVTAVTAVGVQITATPGPNYVGQDLKYTITAANKGPSNATGVVLTDTLPADITSNVTATTSVLGVTASIADGQVTADFGDLNALASDTLTITVVPTETAVADSPLVDAASVATNEFNASPNRATLSTSIQAAADLAITGFTATPNPVEFLDTLTYTIVVTNNGPSPATGVSLASSTAAAVNFVSGQWVLQPGSPKAGGTVSPVGDDLSAGIGNLAVGASATVTIAVTPQQAAIGLISDTVTATGSQFNATVSEATKTLSTTVSDRPGTLQFSASDYEVPENAGSATITVRRIDGLVGQVSVYFTTVPMNATAGLDYTPSAGTLVFPAGVATKTIQVPVLADPYDDHNELVGLALSDPTGGGLLGAVSTATLTIQDIDPNSSEPTVTAVQWTGTPRSITSLIVSFNEPLAADTASNPGNFAVAAVGKKGSFSTAHQQPVTVDTPVYNPLNFTVTLTPAQPLAVNQFYSLLIKGTRGGITDGGGNELAGAGSGHPGTNFTALFAQGTNLKYTDAGGNQVTFGVKGGGYLQDLLTGSGLGQRLVLVGEVPHRTTVTGGVVQGKHGSGRAYLGYSFYGLGQFGNVRVTLKSPPFVIERFPFSPGLPLGPPAPLARVLGRVEAVRPGAAKGKPRASDRNSSA